MQSEGPRSPGHTPGDKVMREASQWPCSQELGVDEDTHGSDVQGPRMPPLGKPGGKQPSEDHSDHTPKPTPSLSLEMVLHEIPDFQVLSSCWQDLPSQETDQNSEEQLCSLSLPGKITESETLLSPQNSTGRTETFFLLKHLNLVFTTLPAGL